MIHLNTANWVSAVRVFLLASLISAASWTDVRAAKILFVINTVVDPATTANLNDQEVFDRLTAQGHTLTLADDDTVAASDAAGMDLVLISSSTGSGNAGVNSLSRNTLRTGRIPSVCYEPGLYDELLLQTEATFGNAAGHTSLGIVDANKGHPLAAGKSGVIEIVISGETAVVSSSALPISVGRDATIIATNATPNVDVGRIAIWAYDVGARLADNSTVNTARKVAFFYNATTSPGVFNENATALLDAAIRWALTPPAAIPVSVVSRTPEPNQTEVAGDVSIVAIIEDGSVVQVNQSSIKLAVNGTAVTPVITKAGNRTTVTYKPAAPLRSGSAVNVELTFTDTANPPISFTSSWSFTTLRVPVTAGPVIQGADGLAVVEAENFDAIAAGEANRWTFATTPATFTGDGTMYALPVAGGARSMPDAITTAPRLDYKVQFAKTGTHYLWFRGADGGGNSLHAGIDDLDPTGTTLDNIDEGCCGTRATGGSNFAWVGGIDGTPEGRASFDVATAGVHTIRIWMREPGQIVDKILITTDVNYRPTGQGPTESRRVGQAPPPSISITSPTEGAKLPSGGPVTITVNASDTDGSIAKVEFFADLNKIGESSQSPFTLTWSNVANGKYTLTAKATDNSGDSAISAPVRIEVGTPPPEILFVVGTPPGNASESAIATRLRRAGYAVVPIDDNDAAPADVNQKALIIVSSTSGSGNITKYRDVTVPILNWEWAAYDGLGMSDADGATLDNSETQIEIVNPAHPLAAGLPAGMRTIFPAAAAQFAVVDPTPSAVVVARAADGSGRATLFGIEKGAALSEATAPGLKAPARRVGIFLGGDTFASLNADGQKLFDAAVAWALNVSSDGAQPKFNAVTRSGNTMTLSWTGSGTLQQADSVTGPWSDAPSQANPQTVNVTGTAKFYRIRR